jgi:hypothetical protein
MGVTVFTNVSYPIITLIKANIQPDYTPGQVAWRIFARLQIILCPHN